MKTRSEKKKDVFPQPGNGPRQARGAYRGSRGSYVVRQRGGRGRGQEQNSEE